MKMKKVMALALAGVMALSIAACGGGSSASTSSGSGSADAGSADAGSAASGALTINIWDANQQAGIQEICNDWTALGNPEVKVEVIDWDNYWTTGTTTGHCSKQALPADSSRTYSGCILTIRRSIWKMISCWI